MRREGEVVKYLEKEWWKGKMEEVKERGREGEERYKAANCAVRCEDERQKTRGCETDPRPVRGRQKASELDACCWWMHQVIRTSETVRPSHWLELDKWILTEARVSDWPVGCLERKSRKKCVSKD